MSAESLVGLVGLARSGKSEVKKHLEASYGYVSYSPGSYILDLLRSEHGDREFSREDIRQRGAALRSEYGPSFFLNQLADKEGARLILDGVRNLVVANELVNRGGVLVGVVARPEVRHLRGHRALDGKPAVDRLDDFVKEELPELRSIDRNGLQILTILMKTEPQLIIDTSDMTIAEMSQEMNGIMQDLGVLPSHRANAA